MPTFLLISRHSPENCPMFNEKVRKVTLQLVTKMEELLKKHGVKMVGTWLVPTEHLMFEVYEAPSYEAFQKFGREPEILATMAYNTTEMKSAISAEEAAQMLLQAE
jgi:hypothetical protein